MLLRTHTLLLTSPLLFHGGEEALAASQGLILSMATQGDG